ncbi:unnamed protein product [Calypogeia fissa]
MSSTLLTTGGLGNLPVLHSTASCSAAGSCQSCSPTGCAGSLTAKRGLGRTPLLVSSTNAGGKTQREQWRRRLCAGGVDCGAAAVIGEAIVGASSPPRHATAVVYGAFMFPYGHSLIGPNDEHLPGSSSNREYGAAQEDSTTSTYLGESTSRSGRRAFSTLCLFALAAFPCVGWIGEAQAEDAPAKPEKKKGRAPSSPYDEDRLLEQNRRMQKMNNAPTEFPGFVREGFQVKVITSDKYVTSKTGLIYYDMVVGNGDLPKDGQQVIFHYTGYNESGRRVDSSYQQGQPARTRVGIQGMIPGFEEGIKSMRPGGRRIIIVPPELGPPVGPSTFFSAKQFEVFDVELLETKDCSRRTLLFYSDVVCD